MTKKHLYIVITILCVVLLYVLFMPVAVTQAPVHEDIEPQEAEVQPDAGIVAPTTTQEVVVSEPEPLILEGTFVGLLEAEDKYYKKFKYMLLNDGVEVLRIDLRPLIGYSDIDTIEKLGVERGDEVTITGEMDKGVFRIESVE